MNTGMLIPGSVPKGVKIENAREVTTSVPLSPNRALDIALDLINQLANNMKMAASGESISAKAKRKVPKATCVAMRVIPHIMAKPRLIRNAQNANFCFGDIASILPPFI